MNSKKAVSLIVSMVLALGLCMLPHTTFALGTTYNVGPSKAYTTLQQVAPLLQPGDLVLVDGGYTYPGDLIFRTSGTAAAKITIRGVPDANGKRPIISGGTNTVEFRIADHYVFESFEVTGGSSRCIYHHGDDLTIRDNLVRDCPGQGILGAETDSGSLTIEYTEITRSGNGSTQHPVYIDTDEVKFPNAVFRMQYSYLHDQNGGNNIKSRASRNEIYHNWIEGGYYREIELIGPDKKTAPFSFNSDVVGNVIVHRANSQSSAFIRFGSDTKSAGSNGRYRTVNNTFISYRPATAYELFGKLQTFESHNNAYYSPNGSAMNMLDASGAQWLNGRIIAGQNNWVPTGTTTIPSEWTGTLTGTNPGFVNAAGDNYSLASGSALINAGTNAPVGPSGYSFPSPLMPPQFSPVKGIQNPPTARPVNGTIDIGAFEF